VKQVDADNTEYYHYVSVLSDKNTNNKKYYGTNDRNQAEIFYDLNRDKEVELFCWGRYLGEDRKIEEGFVITKRIKRGKKFERDGWGIVYDRNQEIITKYAEILHSDFNRTPEASPLELAQVNTVENPGNSAANTRNNHMKFAKAECCKCYGLYPKPEMKNFRNSRYTTANRSIRRNRFGTITSTNTSDIHLRA
jgi:hypothetical protein